MRYILNTKRAIYSGSPDKVIAKSNNNIEYSPLYSIRVCMV